MNKEIIATIKKVKTADELKEVASKNGYNLTSEEAKGYFDLYHNNGQLNDNELDNVTGGSSCIGGKSYSDDHHGYLIVTCANSCPGYNVRDASSPTESCNHCRFCMKIYMVMYCKKRTRWDDPYNENIGTKRTKGPNGRYWQADGSNW